MLCMLHSDRACQHPAATLMLPLAVASAGARGQGSLSRSLCTALGQSQTLQLQPAPRVCWNHQCGTVDGHSLSYRNVTVICRSSGLTVNADVHAASVHATTSPSSILQRRYTITCQPSILQSIKSLDVHTTCRLHSTYFGRLCLHLCTTPLPHKAHSIAGMTRHVHTCADWEMRGHCRWLQCWD